jgi:Tol biopolymer transport system component
MDPQVDEQRHAARNRKLGALAGVAVIIVVVGVAVVLNRDATTQISSSEAPSAQQGAVSLPTGTVPASMVDLDTGVVTPLPQDIAAMSGDAYVVSPDHKQVAFSCCSYPHALYVANVDGTNMHQVSPGFVDAYGAQWSPDGTKLVYQQRDATTNLLGNLFVLDVATGLETQITNLDQSQRWGWWFLYPSFEFDGRQILYQLPSGDQRHAVWNLWSVPVTGGASSMVLRNAGWGTTGGTGARNLAFVTAVSPSTFHGANLMIASSKGIRGSSRRLAQGSIVAPQWSPDGTRIAYQQGEWVEVVNVSTGEVTRVAQGGNPQWVNDHTITVSG